MRKTIILTIFFGLAGLLFITCDTQQQNAPVISVSFGAEGIDQDSTQSLGNVEEGESTNFTFIIANEGVEELKLTGSPPVELGGNNSSSYSLDSEPETSIAPGESSVFTVSVAPQVTGDISASVTISNNSTNAATFQFTLEGYSFVSGEEETSNWNKKIDGNGAADEVGAMALDAVGNIYAAGHGEHIVSASSNWDLWIKKFDRNGNEDSNWNIITDSKGSFPNITDIIVDNEGDVYIAGSGENLFGPASADDWIIKKYDENGNEISSWNKIYDGNGDNDTPVAMAVDSENNLYVAGAGTNLNGTGSGSDWWIKKFDEDGNEDLSGWNKKIVNPATDYASAIVVDSNDDVIVGGFSENLVSGTSGYDMWIMKFSSGGILDPSWNLSFDGNGGTDGVNSIAVDGEDNLYVCGAGTQIVSGTSGSDWWIKKFDTHGNEDTTNWDKKIDGSGSDDTASAIAVSDEGMIYVAGRGDNIVSGTSGADWWIRKYDENGNLFTANWNKQIDGNGGFDNIESLVLDRNGNLFAGGYGENIVTGSSYWDWWIKKYLD